MQSTGKTIGTRRTVLDLADEYAALAQEDEIAAAHLYDCGSYRQSAYFYVQAMEKRVRVEIFKQVNPTTEFFREAVHTHNLDDLLDLWVKIVAGSERMQAVVRDQLERFVLTGVRFGRLHNDLRYPFFQERSSTYAVLDVTRADVDLLRDKLRLLMQFLKDSYRLVGAR